MRLSHNSWGSGSGYDFGLAIAIAHATTPWTWWRPEIYWWMKNAADQKIHFKCKIWNGKPKKHREKTKKTYFRSLVDRGPPKGARLEWKTKKTSRKPKKQKKTIFQKSWGSGPSPKSLGILFFFVFLDFFFWFSQGLFGFLQGALPKESWNIVSFFFFFFCFFWVFSSFFDFLKVFLVFSKGPSPKSLGILFFVPTCQVRVVRFYQSCSPPPPPPPPSPPRPPPRSPDPSGHSRTSTASSRSQWALPDLNRELQIAVGTAGPQPRVADRSGHCRTSTASSRSQWALPDLNRELQIPVGTAGPQPRLPDRRLPDRSGHCRTSTGRKDVR